MPNVEPRETAPADALGWETGDELTFLVWSRHPSYDEDEKPWKCVAAFRFLTEALDYIAYCQDQGSAVVFQSPADCKPVKPTDQRVVYKAAGAA